MKSCQHANKIIDYRLGYLSEDEKVAFEAHLKSCKMCQRELQVEMTIQEELSTQFDPGFIENKIRARLQLLQARDTKSFWLYNFRMVVYGITAAIASFILIPFLLKPLHVFFGNLSKYTDGLSELLSKIPPTNNLFLIIGFCYIFLIVSSILSLAQIRR